MRNWEGLTAGVLEKDLLPCQLFGEVELPSSISDNFLLHDLDCLNNSTV